MLIVLLESGASIVLCNDGGHINQIGIRQVLTSHEEDMLEQ
jgi:hypothetical protein